MTTKLPIASFCLPTWPGCLVASPASFFVWPSCLLTSLSCSHTTPAYQPVMLTRLACSHTWPGKQYRQLAAAASAQLALSSQIASAPPPWACPLAASPGQDDRNSAALTEAATHVVRASTKRVLSGAVTSPEGRMLPNATPDQQQKPAC